MNRASKWPIGTKFICLVFKRIMSHCFTFHWFYSSYHCKYRNGRFPWCKCDNFTPVCRYTSSTNHLHPHIPTLRAGPPYFCRDPFNAHSFRFRVCKIFRRGSTTPWLKMLSCLWWLWCFARRWRRSISPTFSGALAGKIHEKTLIIMTVLQTGRIL